MILLLDDSLGEFSISGIAILICIFLLENTKVLLRQLRYVHVSTFHVERGQFYAALFAILGMILLYRRKIKESSDAEMHSADCA
jgi:hypothetical protein